MDFFVSKQGEKEGPVSIFKIAEKLESGEIDQDTLIWHQGAEGWLPLRDVEALSSVAGKRPDNQPPEFPSPERAEEIVAQSRQREQAASTVTVAPRNVRPFVRFWARMFDYLLVTFAFLLLSGIQPPGPVELKPGESFAEFQARLVEEVQETERVRFAILILSALFSWHLVEAALIHLFGTTPGKFLFGIRIVSREKGRVSPFRSLARSYFVSLLGMGLFFGFFSLVAMIFNFFWLLAKGETLWDQSTGLEVEYAELGIVRILLAILAFFALMSFVS